MMFEQEIARGVALLDERRPGWWTQIDLDHLDMFEGYYDPEVREPCGCVLAQTNRVFSSSETGYYPNETQLLGLDFGDFGAGHYGFANHPFDVLTEEWRSTILRLRAERAPVDAERFAAAFVSEYGEALEALA